MPGTTPTLGFPFPEDADAPDGPAQIEALALAVETAILGALPVVQKYTASTTWTKPAASTGFLGVWIIVTGGGGGSGGVAATASELAPSAGGGGGGTGQAWIPAASLGATETVTIGAAGAAGAAGNNAGGAGGDSSFGSWLTAPGGGGGSGAGNGTTAAYSGSGGSGGTTFSGAASPRLESPGGTGLNGLRSSATVGFSGNGGPSGMGLAPPAVGRSTTGIGLAGRAPGGGAAGSMNIGTQAAAAGQAGGRGEIVVIERYAA